MDSCNEQQEKNKKTGKGQGKKSTAKKMKEEENRYPFAVDEGIAEQKPEGEGQPIGHSGKGPAISTRSADRGKCHHREAASIGTRFSVCITVVRN